MQIYVCVKHVPDSAANITVIDDIRIDPDLAFLLNPYDEHALTEAVTIKAQHPGAEIIAVCLAGDDAEKTVRSALAMGADRGILVVTGEGCDSIGTARALHAAINRDGAPGLILTGKESIDTEGMQTMFRLGALFDFPVATNVSRLEIREKTAVVDSERGAGAVQTYEMALPCVIGAGKGLNDPKYPTFPDIVKSKKKQVTTVMCGDLAVGSQTASMETVRLEPLTQNRQPTELTGGAEQIAREIISILTHEAKVIS